MPPKRKATSKGRPTTDHKFPKRKRTFQDDEDTTIENETEIYDEPQPKVPATGRTLRQRGANASKSQDTLNIPNLTDDGDSSQDDILQHEFDDRTSTPEPELQVAETLPSPEEFGASLGAPDVDTNKEKEARNGGSSKKKTRNKYCNMCDSLRITKENKDIPHKLCEDLADQNVPPRKVALMGHEISLSDIKNFDLFILNIEEKDNVKNFYLGFLLSLIGRDVMDGRFFGEYLILWKSKFCVVVYQTEGQVPDPARLQVNTLDLEQDSDDLIRLKSFRRQNGIKNYITIGIPKDWLYVYYLDGEKEAWENAKATSTLGLFNVAINPDWRRLFAAWAIDPNCTNDYFKKALVLLMEKIRIQLNSAIRKWDDIYGAVSAISILIILPQYNASETLSMMSRRVYRH